MDWTIVVSVLVALLIWPAILGAAVVLVGIPAATIFRGRFRGLMEAKMAHCNEMFSSRHPAATAGRTAGSCCGTESPERM